MTMRGKMNCLRGMVYGALLHLLHWIIEFLYRVSRVIKIGSSYLKKSYWTTVMVMTTSGGRRGRDSLLDLTSRTCKSKKLFKRIPRHIGIIVNEEIISYADISNVIIWCMTMGITFISLYDHDGIIKRSKDAFHDQLLETKARLLGKDSSKFKIDMNSVKLNGTVNGHTHSELIVVNILSHTDGRQLLAQVASDICQSATQQHTTAADITIDAVSRYLQRESCCPTPDPDLILRFGLVASTLGFLPWQIRLSEILYLPSHHNVSYEEFYNILHRFSLCEQRYGH